MDKKKLFKNERQSAVQGMPFIYGENGITIMKLSLRLRLCISEWEEMAASLEMPHQALVQ